METWVRKSEGLVLHRSNENRCVAKNGFHQKLINDVAGGLGSGTGRPPKLAFRV